MNSSRQGAWTSDIAFSLVAARAASGKTLDVPASLSLPSCIHHEIELAMPEIKSNSTSGVTQFDQCGLNGLQDSISSRQRQCEPIGETGDVEQPDEPS